jgi:hypothetical protein
MRNSSAHPKYFNSVVFPVVAIDAFTMMVEIVKLTFDKDGYPELPPGRNYSMAMARDRARWRFGDESMDDFAESPEQEAALKVVSPDAVRGPTCLSPCGSGLILPTGFP